MFICRLISRFSKFPSFLLTALLLFFAGLTHAQPVAVMPSLIPIRVGVLQFGTVGWELDVMKRHELAKKRGIDLQIVPLASPDASTIALQGGAVDMIVSDWIWVSRQRAASNLYSFAPYSNAVGSVMVKDTSSIKTLADLKGKKLGIAGGPFDKTWLLLRAHAQRNFGMDLTQVSQPSYVAPPLLNALALSGQVDVALNFWHYAARLETSGMHPLIEVPEMLKGLGINKPIPLIGWVFREDWAQANSAVVKNFLAASFEAKALLGKDGEWEPLRPIMRAENEAVFKALQTQYRRGIPVCADADTRSAVAATFKVLAETGGAKMVGRSKALSTGTFWPGFSLPACSAS